MTRLKAGVQKYVPSWLQRIALGQLPTPGSFSFRVPMLSYAAAFVACTR